jgi:virginiamycin B lyase
LCRLVGDDKFYIFGLPTASEKTVDLKRDSNGNFWYTAGDIDDGNPPDIIGRLEYATGTITEWIVPTSGGTPLSLTIDGSGMIWFTEYFGNKIGRLDPNTNTFWEFSISHSRPTGIAVDSEDNVWFSEEGTHKVGAISTSGEMVPEFPVGILVLIGATLISVFFAGKIRVPSIDR